MKIGVVIGTRPEAIKMAPLIIALKSRFDVCVISTGQHAALLDNALLEFGITPDINLKVMKEGQSLAELSSKILSQTSEAMDGAGVNALFVHGDTSTAFASALAAFYLKIPVYHVEAGLRTGDISSPFPEEANRALISRIATRHYAPTKDAQENLLKEGISPRDICVTGNTVIDALKMMIAKSPAPQHAERKTILLTCHRRENLDKMDGIFQAVKTIAQYANVIYPIHPNPEIRRIALRAFFGVQNVRLVEPMNYQAFACAMRDCYLILTDSGGIQEESAYLGKPTLVLRDKTERLCNTPNLKVIGTEPYNIEYWVSMLCANKTAYDDMAIPSTWFGNGHAAERILEDVVKRLCPKDHCNHVPM